MSKPATHPARDGRPFRRGRANEVELASRSQSNAANFNSTLDRNRAQVSLGVRMALAAVCVYTRFVSRR